MTPAQTAGALHTVVARRVGLGRRVALLATDAALAQALEQNGCTLLGDPPSADALADFAPEVVVAFDGLADDGAEGFRVVARAAPGADLLFCCANAASATALLQGLAGSAPRPGLAEPQVRGWLRDAGYAVLSRDVVAYGPAASGLAADTEAALRQLFEQLNPDAAADRFLFLARPGEAAGEQVAGQAGLLSVVVSAGPELPPLEGTLRALARQAQRPLEVVVAAPLEDDALGPVLERVRAGPDVAVRLVRVASTDWAARANAGLAAARGRRVAVLEAGDLPGPTHLAGLARALEAGAGGWASTGAPPGPFQLSRWLEGGVYRGRWLLDRDRLGAFPLTFAEGLPEAEALLFCRLALLFPPLGLGGANTLDSPRAASQGAEAVLAGTRGRPLRGLTTLEAQLRGPSAAEVLVEALPEGAVAPVRRALGVLRRLGRGGR